jgi:phage-related protein
MHETFMARIGARIKEFQRKMKQVDAAVKRTAMGTDKQIGADVSEFMRKAALVSAKARALARNKVIIPIEARTQRFQRVMSRIANTIHAFGTVAGNTFRGLGLMMSSTLVPIISTVIGLIGNLGVMIGTIGGSAFALATAFGAAGTAALAFGFAAAPTIKAVFGDIETLTEAQRKARDSFEDLKSTWQDVVKELEKPVLEAFNKAMQIANKVLEATTPMFKAAADAVNSLMDSLSKSVDSKPMQEFFNFLNKSAGPMLETIGKSIGNFVAGFMSMMTAFGPLAEETAKGFLNMSEGFATWAAQLSKSDKFQAFVSYIGENMPKIRSIVGDAIVGIINTFAGFSSTASTMMTDLEGMMAKFREWSSSLASNDGFQKFLGYIVEVTPKVIDLVGNLITFIVNLGIALAPLGSKLLDIANGFIGWMNSMMQAHPIIGQIIAAMTVIVGALIAIVPWVAALRVAFAGLGTFLSGILGPIFTAIGTALSTLWGWFARLVIPITNLVSKIPLLGGALSVLGGPIGIVIAALALLIPVFIRLWNENEKFRNGVTTAWNYIKAFLTTIITAISTFIQTVWGAIVSWWDANHEHIMATAQRIWDTIYNVIVSVLGFIWDIISLIVTRITQLWDKHGAEISSKASHYWNLIWAYIKVAAQNIWANIQMVLGLIKGLFQATWPIISGVVQVAWALIRAIVETGINLIFGIIDTTMSLLQGDWEGAWTAIKNTATNIMDSIISIFKGIDLREIGKNIIQGLTNGIKSMASSVKNAVSNIAGNIKGAISGALNIHSPSRWMRDMVGKNIGAGMIVGMDAMQSKVNAASTKLAQAAMVEPQRTSLAFDTSLSSSDFGRVQHDFGAQMDDFELDDRQPAIINVNVGSKRIAREIVDDISRLQDKKVSNNAVYR